MYIMFEFDIKIVGGVLCHVACCSLCYSYRCSGILILWMAVEGMLTMVSPVTLMLFTCLQHNCEVISYTFNSTLGDSAQLTLFPLLLS